MATHSHAESSLASLTASSLLRSGRLDMDWGELGETRAPNAAPNSAASISGKVLHRVIHSIAHDFRHHLSAVYANSEFLSNRCVDSQEGSELLGEIGSAINCITEQLDSLLLFARTGRSLHPRRQSLTHIVQQAMQMVRSHPCADGVRLASEIHPGIEGCVDHERLRSAIFNLLLNACQAVAKVAPDRREVSVELRRDCTDILVRVSDNGHGVPAAVRNSLFRPFMRGENKQGMGLGLAIAKCVAQEHGGDVYLEHSCPGRTVFALKLSRVALAVLGPDPAEFGCVA